MTARPQKSCGWPQKSFDRICVPQLGVLFVIRVLSHRAVARRHLDGLSRDSSTEATNKLVEFSEFHYRTSKRVNAAAESKYVWNLKLHAKFEDPSFWFQLRSLVGHVLGTRRESKGHGPRKTDFSKLLGKFSFRTSQHDENMLRTGKRKNNIDRRWFGFVSTVKVRTSREHWTFSCKFCSLLGWIMYQK
jgi:hypothetical protein